MKYYFEKNNYYYCITITILSILLGSLSWTYLIIALIASKSSDEI